MVLIENTDFSASYASALDIESSVEWENIWFVYIEQGQVAQAQKALCGKDLLSAERTDDIFLSHLFLHALQCFHLTHLSKFDVLVASFAVRSKVRLSKCDRCTIGFVKLG